VERAENVSSSDIQHGCWLTDGYPEPTELTGFQFKFWSPDNISHPPFAAGATSVVVTEFEDVICILISVLLYLGVTYWQNQITRSEILVLINAVFSWYLLAGGQSRCVSFCTSSRSLTSGFHFECKPEILQFQTACLVFRYQRGWTVYWSDIS